MCPMRAATSATASTKRLCPYDLQTKGGALLDDEIHAIFACAQGWRAHLVLISDSCHSGHGDARRARWQTTTPTCRARASCRWPQLAAARAAAEARPPARRRRGRAPAYLAVLRGRCLAAVATCCCRAARKGPTTSASTRASAAGFNGAFTHFALKALKTHAAHAPATPTGMQRSPRPRCRPPATRNRHRSWVAQPRARARSSNNPPTEVTEKKS
jgi:hypothetical protein